jgi:hypothetical protein
LKYKIRNIKLPGSYIKDLFFEAAQRKENHLRVKAQVIKELLDSGKIINFIKAEHIVRKREAFINCF